jgi:hypothetical protein
VIVPVDSLISEVATAFIPTSARIPVSEGGVLRKRNLSATGLKNLRLKTEIVANEIKGIAILLEKY